MNLKSTGIPEDVSPLPENHLKQFATLVGFISVPMKQIPIENILGYFDSLDAESKKEILKASTEMAEFFSHAAEANGIAGALTMTRQRFKVLGIK